MPRAGLTRSGRYRSIREGWGRGTAVWPPAVRRGVQTKKVVTQEGGGTQKLSELSDVDASYAAPRRHMVAFTGSKWVAFADPVQETGWLVDVKVSAHYVVTGQHHKVRKVINAGSRLCSYVPETKNVVVSERYTLKTSNNRQGVLKMVSEFAPAWIIGVGLPTSTILLELFLGDRPDDFVDILSGFTLKWTQAHVNKEVGPISEYRSLLKCVSLSRALGTRRTTACWI